MPRIASYNVVFGWVVSGPPAEDMYPDLVLTDLVCLSAQSAVADVKQEFGKQGRTSEA